MDITNWNLDFCKDKIGKLTFDKIVFERLQ